MAIEVIKYLKRAGDYEERGPTGAGAMQVPEEAED
jgi:hypothetical protein